MASIRVCSTPGCPELTRQPRCPQHQREHRARAIAEGRMRPRGNQPELIREIRKRAGNRCEQCGTTDGQPSDRTGHPMGLAVHHIVQVRDGGTDQPDNLRLLCDDCHHMEHHDR